MSPSPLQNPTDNENQQLKAAEGLFYQEDIFTIVMYVGLGVAAAFFGLGIVWEFFYRRPKISKYFFFAPNTRVIIFVHKPVLVLFFFFSANTGPNVFRFLFLF